VPRATPGTRLGKLPGSPIPQTQRRGSPFLSQLSDYHGLRILVAMRSAFIESACDKKSTKHTKAHNVYLVRAPEWGPFLRVITMLQTIDFFQEQINQCRDVAARSDNKPDQEFWLKMADRWEGLMRTRQFSNVGNQPAPKSRLRRLRFYQH